MQPLIRFTESVDYRTRKVLYLGQRYNMKPDDTNAAEVTKEDGLARLKYHRRSQIQKGLNAAEQI